MCFAPQRRALFPHLNFQDAPSMLCSATFYIQMCFAPQRRALFQHHNFQKCSENDVLWPFWLQNVLRSTTACNFSFLICPDVSAPAALASLLFDPPEPQNNGKPQCFATFLPFRTCIFSLLTFSISDLLHLSSSPFWLSPCLSFFLAVLFICSYCRKFHFSTSFE